MLASAAARAHHGREEKHSREEALKRSQIALLADGHGEEEEELHTQLLPPHYLLVPFKDCDYELHDGQVSENEMCLHNLSQVPGAFYHKSMRLAKILTW